jgi:copper homeostasis protein
MAAPLLEVIVASVADSIEAEAGGADRLELLIAPELGGLTPPLELVQRVIETVKTPVRVMVRDRPTMSVESRAELEALRRKAVEFARLAIEGIVCGFARDGRIDGDALSEIVSAVPHTPITFHRAFDTVSDEEEAIRILKQFPTVNRVLSRTHGEGINPRLESAVTLAQTLGPEIGLIFAAGLDAIHLEGRIPETSHMEIHVGRAARSDRTPAGPVSRAEVAALKRMLGGD